MTSKKLFISLSVALAVTITGTAGAAYAFGSLLQSKATELANAKAQVEQLTLQQANLTKSKADIEKYEELNAIAQAIVPQDKDQALAVRELTNIAARNRITLASVNFPASTIGGTGSAKKADLSQLEKVKSIPGVYALSITITNSSSNPVTYTQFSKFLEDLENNRRTAAVSTISIQPQDGNANRLVFSLVINAYIKPS